MQSQTESFIKGTIVPPLGDGSQTSSKRLSNLELFRILSMLLIVAHHYVVNSGVQSLYDFKVITGNMVFLQFLGFGGKMGINCFTLLTGYFMARSALKPEKLIRLWAEVIFYTILINLAFYLFGYKEYFTLTYVIKMALPSSSV